MTLKKKEAAATTRREDQENEKKLEDIKEQRRKDQVDQVSRIKQETGDKIVDESRRHFYEQRRKLAAETKEASAKGEKDRAAEKANFDKTQNEKRKKAKSMRDRTSLILAWLNGFAT